ncbi:GGDEF domain-containing protein [Tahibacter harae]|uniref:diguanylate cyclase n=1 Tax=Tahibacter harae TaxID=2963937 RepID=A0ABT1QQJ5_9GAMM|nr:GGDEF domain-containing protein [Tahibacter harae]MCQ4164526.1 diguanylate cyclase [Tahibacter harae]
MSHLAVILLGAGALGAYMYWAVSGQMLDAVGQRLLDNARLLESSLDIDDIRAFGDRADSAAGERLSQRLRRAVAINPDLSGAYVVEPRSDSLRVLATSQPSAGAASSDYLTIEESELLRRGIERAVISDIRVAASERADLTALSAIGAAPQRYVVGVRLNAESLQRSLRLLRLSTLGALLFGVLLALVLSRLLAERLQRRIRSLGERCQALAAGEPLPVDQLPIGDEFDRVIADFDATAQRLREASAQREAALAALTRANATLEGRVEERTRAIEEATHQLKAEIENRLQVEALLAEAALTDGLTGLLNRRAMLEMLVQAVKASRGQGGFSVILADIDHFKRINDAHGHGVGDQVLAAAAQELEQLQGDNRHAARWGGEEFFVLLPHVGLMDACRRAEELRARIERMPTPVRGLRVTLSLGVAEIQPGEPLEDCLKRCDQALYRAKDAGRNAVVAARGNSFATIS